MSKNSLCCCLHADDVLQKWSCQATNWEKLNKRPSSPPKFEISAPGTYSKIYGIENWLESYGLYFVTNH